MLFRQFEYLQAVVVTGNFYLAAEKCHVSQSAISQQIKKLEEELGVQLLDRHNRTFSLTPAGEHFYTRSLVITEDIHQLIKETKKLGTDDFASLHIGYYKGYSGNELSNAIAAFSEKYPDVEITTVSGSHEELYRGMKKGTIDLALNDQRRAFSDTYNNEVLSESYMYIEISSRNPLSRLKQIEVTDLKNMPCILVITESGKKEEQTYYEDIIGIRGDYIFTDSFQAARLQIITGQGFMPVDVIGKSVWFDTAVSRIPLVRNGQPVRKTYCGFSKKDNSGYYVEEFTDMLKKEFE